MCWTQVPAWQLFPMSWAQGPASGWQLPSCSAQPSPCPILIGTSALLWEASEVSFLFSLVLKRCLFGVGDTNVAVLFVCNECCEQNENLSFHPLRVLLCFPRFDTTLPPRSSGWCTAHGSCPPPVLTTSLRERVTDQGQQGRFRIERGFEPSSSGSNPKPNL